MYSNLSPRDSQQAHSDPLLIQENYSSANVNNFIQRNCLTKNRLRLKKASQEQDKHQNPS